jgi:hypothetical protein
VFAVACLTSRADAVSASTASVDVLVPYTILPNYAVMGGGHDASSYWIWYHNQYQPRLADYAIVVRVAAGLPRNFPWALHPVAKPDVTSAQVVALVGRTLTASDRALIRQNMLPVPRASFYALAGAGANAVDTAYRRLSAPNLNARLYTNARGSLSIGVYFGMLAETPESGPTGIVFSIVPVGTGPTSGGAYVCGGRSSASFAVVLFGFTPDVKTFTIYEDGRRIVSSTPAHDPVVPAVQLFALAMPKTVRNFDTVVNHQSGGDVQSLSGCLND